MPALVYRHERILFYIAVALSLPIWAGVFYLTKGLFLLVLVFLMIAYLFLQSGLISYFKGTGALVSDQQFPDLQARITACALATNLKVVPDVYVLHGNGVFNAFATKFLRKHYIILLSDVLDALDDTPDAINFYIGHEMGHIARKHLLFVPLLTPALMLPLLGAAYGRAREYSCDLYGAACCSPEMAQRGLAALAVGGKRYKTLNLEAYLDQRAATSGFWMSFHELMATYPWLVKRMVQLAPASLGLKAPRRSFFAYLPALLIPRIDVLGLVIIYALFLGVMLSEGPLMPKFWQLSSSAASTQAQRSPAAAPQMSAEEAEFARVHQILSEKVAAVRPSLPIQVDEAISFANVYVDDNNMLVFNYLVDQSKETQSLEALKAQVKESKSKQWCTDPVLQEMRDMKVVAGFYYFTDLDADDGELFGIAVDTKKCPK